MMGPGLQAQLLVDNICDHHPLCRPQKRLEGMV